MADDDFTTNHLVVPHEEWLAARRELLEREKAFTRHCDEMSRLQRSLPWERVAKNYVFDGANGCETLIDLFAGRSQLIVHVSFRRQGRLSSLFAARRRVRGHWRPPESSRCHDGRGVPCTIPEARDVPASNGLALQMGLVGRFRFQFRLPRVIHARGNGREASALQLHRARPEGA